LDDKYINSLEDKTNETKAVIARKKRQVKSAGKARANQTKMKQKSLAALGPEGMNGLLQSTVGSRATKKSKSLGVLNSGASTSRWSSSKNNKALKRISFIEGLNECIFQDQNLHSKSKYPPLKNEIKDEDQQINCSAEESKARDFHGDVKLKNFISAYEVLKVVEDESILECDTVDYYDKEIFAVACSLNASTILHSTQRKIRDLIINGLNKRYAHVTPNICRKAIEFNQEVDNFNDQVAMVIEQCQNKTN
jgi:hypothetical protein